MKSSRIAAILRSVKELREPVRVHGSTRSSPALVLARMAEEFSSGPPLLVLCPDDDAAASLQEDLETLSFAILGHAVPSVHLPTWERSPYSSISPSIRTRLARIHALTALSRENPTPRVVFSTLVGACQATMDRKTLLRHSFALKIDATIENREALVTRLLQAGYARVDTVEDPGSFAVRGDILDVFPPEEKPLRIELFGDQVERIRHFDAATQRAGAAALKDAAFGPAREVLLNRETIARAREAIKARADDAGISRAFRDPVLETVQNETYSPQSDVWAPLVYERTENLFRYLAGSSVVWWDELSCEQNWDSFMAEQRELAPESIKSGLIAPAPEALFGWNAELERAVRQSSRLYLDRLDVADLQTNVAEGEAEPSADEEGARLSPKHQVFVRANTDLMQGKRHGLGELESSFLLWKKQGFAVLILCATQSQQERIRYLLDERGFVSRVNGAPEPGTITFAQGSLQEGFRWPAEGLVVLTDHEILGSRGAKSGRRAEASAAKDWSGLQALGDLSVGDAVVHVEHGIGRYQGLVRLSLSGAPSDFLLLEYANRDKLYIPVYRLNVIQKYVGAGDSVTLDQLGSQQFARAKEKVRDAVRKLAFDLVQLYAERQIRPGVRFSPRDGLFREFEAKFPFDETPDQLRAIDQTLADMESGKVMDRLICGDVGYGKTEVAMRAAFRAVSDGKQVAVLVPTTVLAFQHEQSFRTRLQDYPLTIESVSRFKTPKEQKKTLASLAAGKVDIIIGTHRLLSKDVKFNDLGLVIIDEEHRFGVEHKEKLKTFKIDTHVMTLTATPIPRTLNMALAGLREISLINTPPVDRLPIRTYVSKYDEELIKKAVEFELGRGGKVFFLHNRVQSINEIGKRIQELVPTARVGVGHGQMGEGELEKTMLDFYENRTNVLVCTTIIESGLDVPTANTMLINRADSLGLAQLYQIRGRVGRGQQRAYAYLLIPAEGAVTEDAKRRLEVIQKFVELGSGFNVASHDLEIRGGGDLLGPQQSGNIATVGFDLYTELLDEAIRDLQGKPRTAEESAKEPEIKAPFPAYLGDEYVPDVHQRLSLYRRFSAAAGESELLAIEEELKDRFGALPQEAQNLLWMIRIKQLLKKMGIDSITVGPEKTVLVPGVASALDPVKAIALLSGHPARYQLTPDSKFIVKNPTPALKDLFFALETLLRDLSV